MWLREKFLYDPIWSIRLWQISKVVLIITKIITLIIINKSNLVDFFNWDVMSFFFFFGDWGGGQI